MLGRDVALAVAFGGWRGIFMFLDADVWLEIMVVGGFVLTVCDYHLFSSESRWK